MRAYVAGEMYYIIRKKTAGGDYGLKFLKIVISFSIER